MDPLLLLTLAGLALVDATSFGTLVIPLWLMTAPTGLRPGRVLAFLAVVATSYLGVGVLLLLGDSAALDALGSGLAGSRPVLVAQLVVGLALFAASFRVGSRTGERLGRWRDRAVGAEGSTRGVVVLALVAVTAEVATMLPYLGAVGLLAGTDTSAPLRVSVLAAYCLVMVVPALVLLGLRVVLRSRVEALLGRASGWLERAGGEATAWVLGVAGFLVAGDAASRLFS